jgi:hypothetical protein
MQMIKLVGHSAESSKLGLGGKSSIARIIFSWKLNSASQTTMNYRAVGAV